MTHDDAFLAFVRVLLGVKPEHAISDEFVMGVALPDLVNPAFARAAFDAAFTAGANAAAERIRDELVCCDIYARLEATRDEVAHRAIRRSPEYHAICHYGEWAAQIAGGS